MRDDEPMTSISMPRSHSSASADAVQVITGEAMHENDGQPIVRS